VIEAAFWDASALIPLCLEAQSLPIVDRLFQETFLVVWWGTPVEIRSALARLVRMRQALPDELAEACRLLDELKHEWLEIGPSDSVRSLAEDLPDRFGLRAGDALQLAAAHMWTLQNPFGRPFISGDKRLLDAAEQMGFRTIAV
jgi:predicted nucleic acid-binding protein